MFGKSKAANFNYVLAVKDYAKTVEAIKAGTVYLPFNKDIYVKLIDTQATKADSLKDLKAFIRTCKKDKKDVHHYWEGLILEGYTLVGVQYNEKSPFFDKLCNGTTLKYVCAV